MDKAGNRVTGAERMYAMPFGTVFPLYIKKVERKGRTAAQVDEVIRWLTGYSDEEVRAHCGAGTTFQKFFAGAPRFNPAASKITGTICGWRVEDMEDSLVQNIRYLDKLVDELAKGRPVRSRDLFSGLSFFSRFLE